MSEHIEPPGVVEGLTASEREDEFFRLLSAGCTVREAARAVAINFSTFYRKRERDPVFAKRWEDATRVKVEHLITEAERRAMRGSDKLLMFLLQSFKPETFGVRQRMELTNPDGSLAPQSPDERAARIEAILATARARKMAKSVDDLL
jgi:hypothetical protein